MALKKSQKSLKAWTKQKWRTKSGKKSSKTGERYLPEAAIKALTPAEYAATSRAKRKGTKQGKQFVKQPKAIAKKTAKYRKGVGGSGTNRRRKKSTKKSRSKISAELRPELCRYHWANKVFWAGKSGSKKRPPKSQKQTFGLKRKRT